MLVEDFRVRGAEMSDDSDFDALIQRLRRGDQDAAAELVRRYEPAIRRAVRFRLVDTRLGAMLDSMDICQSVLASFFVRATAGQYDLDQPEQLLKLLVTMARNKLAGQARRQQAERRDYRRLTPVADHARELVAEGVSPSRQVAAQDLLQEVYRRLSPEERRLAELRNQGADWAAIAAEVGGSPVALRKRLSRALDRVTRELGLDDEDHE
jgi:RNA polymerase sigma-70 factor (ECF subfamily)